MRRDAVMQIVAIGDCLRMNRFPGHIRPRGWWLGPALAAVLFQAVNAAAAGEQSFPVLEIGALSYTNVTVTTKAADYIFILHSAGMANIKVKDLPSEVRAQLGYASSEKPRSSATNAAAWARQTVAKLEVPQVKEMEKQLQTAWRAYIPTRLPKLAPASPRMVVVLAAAAFLLYVFYCYCCLLICAKTGKDAGILIWLPLFQTIPLFRAAGMSGWWFLSIFVPGLNVIAYILWSFKIAKARDKGVLVGVLLLLPPFTILAFLYLALSNGAPAKQEKIVDIMTWEAA